MGNIVNRVFDSSGPEGKVRGTPQQIIDKYTQLARDASLGNDRVAAENFQQHAEHYTRMLGEAQREMEAKREQQEAQQQANRERQQAQNRERQQAAQAGGDDQPAVEAAAGTEPQPDVVAEAPAADADVMDVAAPAAGDDTGLVETPENKPAPKPRRPRSRKPKAPKGDDAAPADSGSSDTPPASEAAE